MRGKHDITSNSSSLQIVLTKVWRILKLGWCSERLADQAQQTCHSFELQIDHKGVASDAPNDWNNWNKLLPSVCGFSQQANRCVLAFATR